MERWCSVFVWLLRGVLIWLALGLSGGELMERAEAQTRTVTCPGSPLLTRSESWVIDLAAQTCSYNSMSALDAVAARALLAVGLSDADTNNDGLLHGVVGYGASLYDDYNCALILDGDSAAECDTHLHAGLYNDYFAQTEDDATSARDGTVNIILRDKDTNNLYAEIFAEVEIVDYGSLQRSEFTTPNGIIFYGTDYPEVIVESACAIARD